LVRLRRRVCAVALAGVQVFRSRGGLRALGSSAKERGDRGLAHRGSNRAVPACRGAVVDGGRRSTAKLGVLGAGTSLRAPELRETTRGGAVEQHKRLGRPIVRQRRGIEQRTELTRDEVRSRFWRSTGLGSRQRDQVESLAYGRATTGLVVARGAVGRREHGGAGVLRGGAEAGCVD
jgi:hypothetical protein